MDDGCFTRKSLSTNDLRSCTTCIVYVTLSKISISFGIPHLAESGCKGKEFQTYLPNFFGSFFSLFFPARLQRSLAKGKHAGKKPDRNQNLKHRRFVFKSGCKGKNSQAYPPNFSEVFFEVFFPKPQSLENLEEYCDSCKPELPNKMSYNEASVPESGCKTRHSTLNTQTLNLLFYYEK